MMKQEPPLTPPKEGDTYSSRKPAGSYAGGLRVFGNQLPSRRLRRGTSRLSPHCKHIVRRRGVPAERGPAKNGAKNGVLRAFGWLLDGRREVKYLMSSSPEFCVFSVRARPRGVSGDSRAVSARCPWDRNVLRGPEQRVALIDAPRSFGSVETKRKSGERVLSRKSHRRRVFRCIFANFQVHIVGK